MMEKTLCFLEQGGKLSDLFPLETIFSKEMITPPQTDGLDKGYKSISPASTESHITKKDKPHLKFVSD